MKLINLRIKKLYVHLKQNSGRNNTGKITIKNRGGGSKSFFRLIDYKRFFTIPAIILKQENIKYLSATIALILYKNGLLSYIISAVGLKNGDFINHQTQTLSFGCNILVKNSYVGNILYNLELIPGLGSQLCKAAGSYFQIINIYNHKNNKFILIRLKSKQKYLINSFCSAVIGVSSYLYHKYYSTYYKAGQRRWLGKRPHVRGVAMNPIDHPHGGNTSGGRCSVSIYGVLSKGFKTKKKRLINFKNAF